MKLPRHRQTSRIASFLGFTFMALGLLATPSRAATILLTNQASTVETSQTASAFFTNSPDNLITLSSVATTGTPGLVAGNIGAGDAATFTSSGTFTIVGDATSAGGWLDGNGIPAGITLTFNIQFSGSTPDANSFLTTQGNSGTQLGNGIGTTQTAGGTGDLGAGETLEISGITISDVNFSGSTTEPGFSLHSGTVFNPRWNRLRSNNFNKVNEGIRVTVGSDTWGFGTSTGTLGSNLSFTNNYTAIPGFETAGPLVFSVQAGAWNLKGLGFRYEVSYDITGSATIATWAGNGSDDNWSTGANWNGGVAPASNQSIRFGAALRQANNNDIPNLSLTLLDFTAGGFTLSGFPVTNTFGISNAVGINALNLDVIYTGSNERFWNIASGSELAIGGDVQSYGNGNFEVSGGGTLSVANGGSISVDPATPNSNLRLGTVAGDVITLNVNSGGLINIPNAPTGSSASRLRIGAVAGSSAVVNINNGGIIMAPDNAINPSRSLIEVGLGAGTVSVLNLNAGGLLHAQRVESADGSEADSTFNFNGGLLEAHRILGSTTYFDDMDRVQVQAGGAVIHTTNSIAFLLPLTADVSSPGGGLTKLGDGTLLLPAGNTYTGPTIVSNGALSVVLPFSSSSLTLRPDTILNVGVSNSAWNATSATLDGNNVLNLNFGTGSLSTPLTVGTLTANGTTIINVSGSATAAGSYPLIDYSARSGSGSFQLGTAPEGFVASLVTNVGNSSIDLLLSSTSVTLTVARSGTDIILTGSGTPNGTYSILNSSDVTAPLSGWAVHSSGSFDGSGTFSTTIPAAQARQFFVLATP